MNTVIQKCVAAESKNIEQIQKLDLGSTELLKQEMHLKIDDNNLIVIRAHPEQDKWRLSVFSSMLTAIGKLPNCEFILNMDDDVPNFDPMAPRLCFSRRKEHGNIMIPDPHCYNLCNNVAPGISAIDIPFVQKDKRAVFAGSDTGVHKMAKDNQRFQFCYNNQSSMLGDFVISNFVEIPPLSLLMFPGWKEVESPFISIGTQLTYRYVLNINGNTTAWDRLLWAMSSNSLAMWLYPQEDQMSWYYHYLLETDSLIMLKDDDWEKTINYFNNHEDEALVLAENQKEASKPLLNIDTHQDYFKMILNQYADKYNSLCC